MPLLPSPAKEGHSICEVFLCLEWREMWFLGLDWDWPYSLALWPEAGPISSLGRTALSNDG